MNIHLLPPAFNSALCGRKIPDNYLTTDINCVTCPKCERIHKLQLENKITATVLGTVLGNTHGNEISAKRLLDGEQEMVLVVKRNNGIRTTVSHFNIVNLLELVPPYTD